MNDRSSSHSASGLDLISNDTLPEGGAFSVSPFDQDRVSTELIEPVVVAPAGSLPAPAAEPLTLNHTHLVRQAASPVAKLLYGSVWVLKAWQLDLEFPSSIICHLDQRLAETLKAQFGDSVDIDEACVSFSTALEPAVEADGRERFEQRLSLRELGRQVLNPAALLALHRCAEADRPLSTSAPSLTVEVFFNLLMDAQWTLGHEQLQSRFWQRHGNTWEMLARLAFLDGLTRLHSRRRIDTEGRLLALDALGLKRFPRSIQEVQRVRPSGRSAVCGLALNGELIPGVFHVRSNTTGHCYIHILGSAPQCHDYISDDAPWSPDKALTAINASAWHRHNLTLGAEINSLTLAEASDDVFAQLRVAQQRFSSSRVSDIDPVESADAFIDDDHATLMPIEPALALVCALDHWQHREPLLARIPTPQAVANRIMNHWLKAQGLKQTASGLESDRSKQTHALITDPQRVFIRYLRGTSTTPWGHPRIAAGNVIVTPDETPVTLSQALMSRFRATEPQGYDDEGGRWVVYADPSGEGIWSPNAELRISTVAVESYIQSVDFLDIMRHRLDQFWHQQRADIERSLWSTFVAQALLALKSGDLSQDHFQLVTGAVEQVQGPLPHTPNQLRWSTVGFYLSNGLPLSSDCPACVGLLLIGHKNREGGVLYQAGQSTPFVPFSDRQQLIKHLATAAADPAWRETLLNYMPRRFHVRLSYILELWGGVRTPAEPVSILRPWTDPLYNPDTHAARLHQLCEQEIHGSPIGFLCDGLRRNSQYNAEDSIVTDGELALRAWIEHIQRLQLLLAPMALVLPAASIAALTASAASVALNVQAANLAGDRQEERRQALFAILSMGLLHMTPATPRLLQAFSKLTTPAAALGRGLTRTQTALPARGFGDWLRRATHPRKTLLKPFFNGAALMKTWSVAGNAEFGTSAVQVWKLGRKFLLWTSDRTQARTLVVSSHGYYLPWTRTTAIPNGTELRTYAPHGHELVDPMLHRIASQSVRPYALLNTGQPVPGPGVGPFPDLVARDTLMAGTSLPGRIKNYTLAKFQSEHYESYRDISQIVRNSHQPPLPSPLPAMPMDVLTVRNRFGMTNPTLQDLFRELNQQGIHYDNILLVHCRCPAVGSMLGRSPSFVAPQGQSPITP
jgi:hypothetical protein